MADITIPDGSYVSEAAMGNCKVCGEWQDLRCGACFDCAALVMGRLIEPGVHELWERSRPQNKWFYREEQCNG